MSSIFRLKDPKCSIISSKLNSIKTNDATEQLCGIRSAAHATQLIPTDKLGRQA